MLTICSVILEKSGIVGNIGSSTSVIRAFRIGRLLRLIKRAKSLMLIFETLIKALPALANVGSLLCLVLFIFSILGTNLFAYVRPFYGLEQSTFNF